jgi:hypothetical protein
MKLLILCLGAAVGTVRAQPAAPLKLEKTVLLQGVEGRIDHLSMDVDQQRLFVAALGNNTVEILDIQGAKRLHTITGLQEPQGVLYVPGENRLFVANAKDGARRVYDGGSFALLKTIDFSEDADNSRFDAAVKRVYVGYGSGALGVLGAMETSSAKSNSMLTRNRFGSRKVAPGSSSICRIRGRSRWSTGTTKP